MLISPVSTVASLCLTPVFSSFGFSSCPVTLQCWFRLLPLLRSVYSKGFNIHPAYLSALLPIVPPLDPLWNLWNRTCVQSVHNTLPPTPRQSALIFSHFLAFLSSNPSFLCCRVAAPSFPLLPVTNHSPAAISDDPLPWRCLSSEVVL